MNRSKWILAGVLTGALAVALGNRERLARLAPAEPTPGGRADEHEPVLGYDGMDQETLLDWIDSANLDDATIGRMIRYEETNRQRVPVLEALSDLRG